MRERQALNQFFEGTSIKIKAILSIKTADTAKITIDDPSENEKVSNANMTKEADKIYTYVWQSTKDTDDDGDYVVTIKITSGGYIAVTQDNFTLVEQD